MVWTFSYAIPSLMIMAVLIGHYVSLPRLPVKKNLIFVYLTSAICLCMSLDIISSWADMHDEFYHDAFLYVLNSAYFVAFFACAFLFHIFTANVLNVTLYDNRIRRFLITLPMIFGDVIVVTSSWTHWFYYIDDEGYHSSVLYNVLYFIYAIYILLSFLLIIKQRHLLIRRREWEILVGCNTILSIGLIVRYAFPSLLLMNIFTLTSFIVLFLGFQNPDLYLIERTFIFNRVGLRDYITELYNKKSINALVFGIKNFTDKLELYGLAQTNQGLYLIQNYLRKEFPKNLIFYNDAGSFIIFGSKPSEWPQIYSKLLYRFQQPWISMNTEIYWDIGGTAITLTEKNLPMDILLRIFNIAYSNPNKIIDNELITIENADINNIVAQNDMKRSLEFAIDNNEVEVFLQPIVNSKTGKVVGAEALSRIRNSSGDLLYPGDFIPIAERNGKINQLGKQVFRMCCEYANLPEFRALGLSFINVNLSPIQLMRNDLDQSLATFVRDHNLDAEFIHLEITEEAFVDEYMIEKQITLLNKSGFRFVLDDYGTGYSNIYRIRKTPLINIKLDKTLVWDYCKKPGEILPSEITAFKKSGFEITAEGIENAEMAIKMRDIGCDYLQGYFYSKPIPFNEFIKYVNEQK